MSNSCSVDAYIPSQFQDGRPVEKIMLICDVDGVIRNSTEGNIDPLILSSIKELITEHHVDVTFISGTPVTQRPLLETWRRGNITLDQAVGNFLIPDVQEKKVMIFGALGGQRLTHELKVEITEQYPLDIVFELGKILLSAFLEEVQNEGTQQQKTFANTLKRDLDELKLKNRLHPSAITPDEFSEIISHIHSKLDPNFRLVSCGTFIESQTSNPPWNTDQSFKWIQSQLNNPHLLISKFPEEQKQVATGFAHREDEGFNFLMISKTNKSLTIKKHTQEKLRSFPDALIVTIGDTQVDFPMHQHAHLAYHVGKEQVWKNHALPQCMLVRDQFGRDSQHVAGTLHILNVLKNGRGKSISEWY